MRQRPFGNRRPSERKLMTGAPLGRPGGGLSATAQVMVFGGVLEHVVDRSEHRARRLSAGGRWIRTLGPASHTHRLQGRRQIFEVADADLGARGRLCPSESLLHARRRTRRHKRSAFRALHRAHPRRRAGVRITFPPPAKGGPDSQTLPFAEHLLSSVLFLWHYDYSNQFCLNDRRNSIVPINI